MKKLADNLQKIAMGNIWIESVLKECLPLAENLEETISIKTYLNRPNLVSFENRMTLQNMVIRLRKLS